MLNLMSFSPSNFSRYVSQNEQYTGESNGGTFEWTEKQQNSTINNIPSLMSISIPSPIMTTNILQKSTIPSSVIKENIEPLPFPQHAPGPIQRPNKLTCSPTSQQSTFLTDSPPSPSTPYVLKQINQLFDHQNSITTIPSTPDVNYSTNSSTLINDISTTGNVSWSPFSSTVWSAKYDSSWSGTNIQSPNLSLTTQIQNPFVQRQISREETSIWPTVLGTATPRSTPSTRRLPRNSTWNDLFSSNVPSSTESINNNSSLKFWPVSDSTPGNTQENETNNPFWNPMNLDQTRQTSSTSWWPKHPTDKTNDDNDQSRWDFAR